MEVFQVFQEVWAIRALVASCLVGIMCGVLGAFIVLRNMSLIGDALSHAILPGVVIAFVIMSGYSAMGFFVGAVIAGLISAVAITWIQQNVSTKNDAAIGIVFTAMFSIGVIGISWISRNEGVHLDLKDFLFGNVLTVSNDDLALTAGITGFVILSITVLYRYLFISTFQSVIAETMGISVKLIHYFLMLLLSFAVVASLQTVGVILVVAMLITPASTALLLSDKLQFVIALSAFLGLLSAVTGLLAAIFFETTPGPAMAVMATLFYLLAALFAPKKGVLAKFLVRYYQQQKVEAEDLLKQSFKLHTRSGLNLAALSVALGFTASKIRKHLRRLSNQGLILQRGDALVLTSDGLARANALVRAHRLWETYLATQVGLGAGQIHEDAERFEHLLTEELLDEVDEKLGFPTQDPHGSPIPNKYPGVVSAMANLQEHQEALISAEQMNTEVSAALWKIKLEPYARFQVLSKSKQAVKIQSNGKVILVDDDLAHKINVKPLDHSSSEPI